MGSLFTHLKQASDNNHTRQQKQKQLLALSLMVGDWFIFLLLSFAPSKRLSLFWRRDAEQSAVGGGRERATGRRQTWAGKKDDIPCRQYGNKTLAIDCSSSKHSSFTICKQELPAALTETAKNKQHPVKSGNPDSFRLN
jgi:hypothetical protein